MVTNNPTIDVGGSSTGPPISDTQELVLGHEDLPSENGSEFKIPLRTIDCSGCAVTVGMVYKGEEIVREGDPHYVHKGEWVKVMPVMTVMEVMALSKLQNATNDIGAIDKAFADLCKELSLRIVEWNWTDMRGEVMPQPYKEPGVIAQLTTDEMFWLTNAMREAPDDRKND